LQQVWGARSDARHVIEWDRKDIAQAFGASARSVAEWVKIPDFPEAQRRGRAFIYPSTEVIQWHVQREIRRVIGQSNTATDTGAAPVDLLNLQQERARLARVQAEARELELAERRGQLVGAGAARQALAHAFGAARSILLSVHAKCAETYPELPVDVVEGIRRMHHEALTILSETPMPGEVEPETEEDVTA